MKEFRHLSEEEVKNLPMNLLPMMVLSTSMVSFFSFGIRAVKRSQYSHFMWAHRPGYFASQELWYKEVPVEKYLNISNTLKFWAFDGASTLARQILIQRINTELARPKWKTRYDFWAIIGQLFGIERFQSPFTKICSEHAIYLREIDSRYDLDKTCGAPAPSDINEWLKKNTGYYVYGKYQIEE